MKLLLKDFKSNPNPASKIKPKMYTFFVLLKGKIPTRRINVVVNFLCKSTTYGCSISYFENDPLVLFWIGYLNFHSGDSNVRLESFETREGRGMVT